MPSEDDGDESDDDSPSNFLLGQSPGTPCCNPWVPMVRLMALWQRMGSLTHSNRRLNAAHRCR